MTEPEWKGDTGICRNPKTKMQVLLPKILFFVGIKGSEKTRQNDRLDLTAMSSWAIQNRILPMIDPVTNH